MGDNSVWLHNSLDTLPYYAEVWHQPTRTCLERPSPASKGSPITNIRHRLAPRLQARCK